MNSRYERKFCFNVSQLNVVEAVLRSFNIFEAYPKRSVFSIYYDSYNFTSFHESNAGIGDRIKRRVRWYDNNIDSLIFENKIKRNELGYKLNNFNQISNWVDITIDTFKENFSSLDENNNYYVDIDELTKYPIFIQQEIIKSFFSSNNKWRKHIWDRLREFLLFSSTGEYLILDELSKVLKDRKKIFIISNVKKSLEAIFEFKSDGPVSKKIGKYHFNLNKIIHSKKFTSNNSKELIDFDLIKKKSLILRPWENGDKMIPLGMKNFKKISDILIDNKINRFEKKNKYILCSNDKIIWLCGLKLDERFKITSKTKSFAELNWKKNIYD